MSTDVNRVFDPKLHHLCLCQIREEKCFAPRKATIITKLIIEQMEIACVAGVLKGREEGSGM